MLSWTYPILRKLSKFKIRRSVVTLLIQTTAFFIILQLQSIILIFLGGFQVLNLLVLFFACGRIMSLWWASFMWAITAVYVRIIISTSNQRIAYLWLSFREDDGSFSLLSAAFSCQMKLKEDYFNLEVEDLIAMIIMDITKIRNVGGIFPFLPCICRRKLLYHL